jgi:hypothetical protein
MAFVGRVYHAPRPPVHPARLGANARRDPKKTGRSNPFHSDHTLLPEPGFVILLGQRAINQRQKIRLGESARLGHLRNQRVGEIFIFRSALIFVRTTVLFPTLEK